jgi:acyl carrier protein
VTIATSHPDALRDDEAIRDRLRSFVLSTFYVPDPAMLADDTSLVQTGTVDSTGILEIIAFIGSEFGLNVPTTEVTPANFDSIRSLTGYVVRKLSQAGRA